MKVFKACQACNDGLHRLWLPTIRCQPRIGASETRQFTFDFIQKFHSPICVNAFLKGLDENGISYDFQDGVLEEPSNMRDISSLC